MRSTWEVWLLPSLALVRCSATVVIVPAACSAADPRSESGCTAQINAALAAVGHGGQVLLEATKKYVVICPETKEEWPSDEMSMPGHHLVYPPPNAPSALAVTGGHNVSSTACGTLILPASSPRSSPSPYATRYCSFL
jgi:hypothetical protein